MKHEWGTPYTAHRSKDAIYTKCSILEELTVNSVLNIIRTHLVEYPQYIEARWETDCTKPARQQPASSIAKPACMNITRAPQRMSHMCVMPVFLRRSQSDRGVQFYDSETASNVLISFLRTSNIFCALQYTKVALAKAYFFRALGDLKVVTSANKCAGFDWSMKKRFENLRK